MVCFLFMLLRLAVNVQIELLWSLGRREKEMDIITEFLTSSYFISPRGNTVF